MQIISKMVIIFFKELLQLLCYLILLRLLQYSNCFRKGRCKIFNLMILNNEIYILFHCCGLLLLKMWRLRAFNVIMKGNNNTEYFGLDKITFADLSWGLWWLVMMSWRFVFLSRERFESKFQCLWIVDDLCGLSDSNMISSWIRLTRM